MQAEQLKPKQILETALYVHDIDEAVKLYRDILGLVLIHPSTQRSAFFYCGAGVLILFNADLTCRASKDDPLPVPTHGARGEGHVCFAANRAEIAVWKQHLEHHGIAIERELQWPNGAQSLYFRDPSGNSLEFAEPQLWNMSE